MSTSQVPSLGNPPAGFSCVRAALIAGNAIVTMHWLAPGGREVYAHVALAHPGEEKEEEFWSRVIDYVTFYVRSRDLGLVSFENGATTFKGAALSDKPPPSMEQNNVHQTPPFFEGHPAADGGFDLYPAARAAGGGPAE